MSKPNYPAYKSSVISDVNQVAMAYAKDHAGELLGTKWYDGERSTEPSEKWPVSETIKQAVREIIVDVFSRETPHGEIVERIQRIGAFSEEQAQLIASTETRIAMARGNIEAWKQTGAVKSKKWMVSQLTSGCEECKINQTVGPIPLGDNFPSGHLAPPAHIGCLCVVGIAELKEPYRKPSH